MHIKGTWRRRKKSIQYEKILDFLQSQLPRTQNLSKTSSNLKAWVSNTIIPSTQLQVSFFMKHNSKPLFVTRPACQWTLQTTRAWPRWWWPACSVGAWWPPTSWAAAPSRTWPTWTGTRPYTGPPTKATRRWCRCSSIPDSIRRSRTTSGRRPSILLAFPETWWQSSCFAQRFDSLELKFSIKF